MDIENMAAAIAKWAGTQPLIRKAYLFGSRVRGTNNPDSDLDIAVEVFTLSGDSDAFTTWIGEKERLKASIAGVVPVIVDLDWYGGADETPCIHSGLQAGSRVVYDADLIAQTN